MALSGNSRLPFLRPGLPVRDALLRSNRRHPEECMKLCVLDVQLVEAERFSRTEIAQNHSVLDHSVGQQIFT